MKVETFGFSTLATIWVVGLIGWVANLIQVIMMGSVNMELTTLFVLKLIGIFVGPLGSVMGIIGFF